MTDITFRYFKVGVVPVKVEFNKYGARVAYALENGELVIDNTYIPEIMNGDEVVELTKEEFVKLI